MPRHLLEIEKSVSHIRTELDTLLKGWECAQATEPLGANFADSIAPDYQHGIEDVLNLWRTALPEFPAPPRPVMLVISLAGARREAASILASLPSDAAVLAAASATADEQITPKPQGPNPTLIEPATRDREAEERAALAMLLTVGPNAAKIAKTINVKRTTLLGWPTFRTHYDRAKHDAELNKQGRRGRRSGSADFEDESDD